MSSSVMLLKLNIALPSLFNNFVFIRFDQGVEGFVAQVKHPHTLSDESDLVDFGYASSVLETALDC